MGAEAVALGIDARPWTLATLADEDGFARYHDAIAGAIADRFTLKVHINPGGRQRAFAAWIAALAEREVAAIDHRDFIAVCAGLIASLAAHTVVSYSPMVGDRADRMVDTVLACPDEVTALAAGAALYVIRVRELTGADPSVPLSAMVVENAAASLRRRPAAATRFRELLQLSTPWV